MAAKGDPALCYVGDHNLTLFICSLNVLPFYEMLSCCVFSYRGITHHQQRLTFGLALLCQSWWSWMCYPHKSFGSYRSSTVKFDLLFVNMELEKVFILCWLSTVLYALYVSLELATFFPWWSYPLQIQNFLRMYFMILRRIFWHAKNTTPWKSPHVI